MLNSRFQVVSLFLISSFFCLFGISSAHGWGFDAHRMISDRAIRSLPTEIQSFFDRHRPLMSDLSVYPDRRRGWDRAEAPRHYVDLELLPGDRLPAERDEVFRHFGQGTLEKAGYLPWRIQEVHDQLVEALRDEDYPRSLFLAGTLCHYLADAHVPLHTTENYNGQLTGDTGVHARFESRLVEQFPDVLKANYQPAEYIDNLPSRTIEIVEESHSHLSEVLEGDRNNRYPDHKKDGYSLVKARETHGPLARRRLNAAATSTASFWYTAWVEAGRPELPHVNFSDYVELRESSGAEFTYYQDRWESGGEKLTPFWRGKLEKLGDFLGETYKVELAELSLSNPRKRSSYVRLRILDSSLSDDHERWRYFNSRLERLLHPATVRIRR